MAIAAGLGKGLGRRAVELIENGVVGYVLITVKEEWDRPDRPHANAPISLQ